MKASKVKAVAEGNTAFEDASYRKMYGAMAKVARERNYDPRYAYMACRGAAMSAHGRMR